MLRDKLSVVVHVGKEGGVSMWVKLLEQTAYRDSVGHGVINISLLLVCAYECAWVCACVGVCVGVCLMPTVLSYTCFAVLQSTVHN